MSYFKWKKIREIVFSIKQNVLSISKGSAHVRKAKSNPRDLDPMMRQKMPGFAAFL